MAANKAGTLNSGAGKTTNARRYGTRESIPIDKQFLEVYKVAQPLRNVASEVIVGKMNASDKRFTYVPFTTNIRGNSAGKLVVT